MACIEAHLGSSCMPLPPPDSLLPPLKLGPEPPLAARLAVRLDTRCAMCSGGS